MKKRQYSESDKATALALLKANRGNVKKKAKELAIPRCTLQRWQNGQGVSRDVAEKQHEKEGQLADMFERISWAYGRRALDPEVVRGTNGKDAVVAAAVAAEKRQLLRGEATEIALTGAHTDAECLRRIDELLAESGYQPPSPSLK